MLFRSPLYPHLDARWQIRVVDYGMADSLPAMAACVLAAAPPGRVAIAGHSMGGRVALEVLRQAPERISHVALLDTGHLPRAAGEAGAQEAAKRPVLAAQAGYGYTSEVARLPIALPGIVTGIALLAAFKMMEVNPGFWTIVVGHATFCVVIVHNNVVARLRRLPTRLWEASMDLGADTFTTLRHVILPQLGTALLAGGILAFALSVDELIVTTFTAGPDKTLPIWLMGQLGRPRESAITNVVALALMVVTMPLILLA